MKDGMEELAKKIPFRWTSHLALSTKHVSNYENEDLGLVCSEATPMFRNGQTGKPERQFFEQSGYLKVYGSLVKLLEDRPAIAKKAAALYGPKQKNQKKKKEDGK